MVMSSSEAIQARLLAAPTTAEIISAAWDAFEYIRLCANELAGRHTGNFPAWTSAAAPACEGRDALGRAPSVPRATGSYGTLSEIAETNENAVARRVGELAGLVHERLADTARQPAPPGDAEACLRASEAAAEIRGLFAGA
jgi:hypothetical protein